MASLNDIETKVKYIIALLDDRRIKTITGVLPLTFTTTEDKLRDWEIMGNDDIHDGKQGVGERTENIFNENANDTKNGYVNPGRLSHNGNVTTAPIANANLFVSEYIEIEESKDYTISDCYLTSGFGGCFYNSEKAYISGFTYNNVNHGNKTVKTPANAKYIRISAATYIGDNHYKMMVTKGSIPPSSYVPFGYEIGISVNGTPQTFYIGNAPLTAGQSISKTLTGVDIATAEGENTISTTLYNKPEMTIKYK